MVINPSNAVISKARAKYGKRLIEKDYTAMLRCGSVTEVVHYLRSYTCYQQYLSRIIGADIHRGFVEHILREELFNNFLSLCRYNANHSPVTGFILRQTEIDQLMKYLTLLSIGKPEEYIFSLPLYFDEHTELDLQVLSGCRSYSAFLDTVKYSKYKEILSQYKPSNGKLRLSEIENALDRFSFVELYKDIGKVKNKQSRKELTELFDSFADYNNYSRILRLKKYYDTDNETIKEYLMPFGNLKGNKADEILCEGGYEEVSRALTQTRLGKKLQKKQIGVSNRVGSRSRFELCRHNLYFSQNPEVVLLSYYILSDTELNNVITIIEGVRYGLSPKEIKDLIII